MDVDAEPVVDIKSGQTQESLLSILKPSDLSPEHANSVLQRLKKTVTPGKPATGTPAVGDCELWTGCRIGGYGIIKVDGKMKRVTRIAFEIKKNVTLPPNLQVRHLCANPACVAATHLEIGTAQDNANDKVESGRSLSGEKHPGASITAETAKAIFTNSMGLKHKDIAALYGCSEVIVERIRTGSTWSSVTGAQKRKRPARKKSSLEPKDEEIAKKYVLDRIQEQQDADNKEHVHWIWNRSKYPDQYGVATFKGKGYKAHVLSWRAFNQCKKTNGKHVLHDCKRKDCVNPTSLRLGTAKENMADKVRDGTDSRGTKNKRAKLNDQAVREIRGLRESGASQKTIAGQFSVSTSTINDVLCGRRWGHLKTAPESL